MTRRPGWSTPTGWRRTAAPTGRSSSAASAGRPGSPRPPPAGRRAREVRIRDLLAVHEADWVEPFLSIDGVRWTFSRGFATVSGLSLCDYLRHRDLFCRSTVVLGVDCDDPEVPDRTTLA